MAAVIRFHGWAETHCPRDERHAVNPSEFKSPSEPHSVGIIWSKETENTTKRNREVHPSVASVVDENIQHSAFSITVGSCCLAIGAESPSE